MNKKEHAPSSKKKKTEKVDAIQEATILQNMDDSTVCKSISISDVDLTDDGWLIVFSYLGVKDKIRAGLVCKQWRELGMISWNRISELSYTDFSSLPGCLKDNLQQVILRRSSRHLRCLHLDEYPHSCLNTDFLGQGYHGASLQELNMSYSNIEDTGLSELVERFPRLKSFHLMKCQNISEYGLLQALKTLKWLKSLTVAYNNWLTGEIFRNAPQSLTEVRALRCDNLTDSNVSSLGKRCSNLESLDISGCKQLTGQSIRDIEIYCSTIKSLKGLSWDNSILSTLCNLPLLEELSFADYQGLFTYREICKLRKYCLHITSIGLRSCLALTGADFSHFSPWPHLKSITIDSSFISNKELTQLCSTDFELKKVYLHGCPCITDKGVGDLLSANTKLLELGIYNCNIATKGLVSALELGLQRRQCTLPPLKIYLIGKQISRKKINILRKNPKCVVKEQYSENCIRTEMQDKYVNATQIKGYYGQNRFIAAQAPLKTTVEDTWNVIKEQDCKVVVVLCKLTDEDDAELEMSCIQFCPREPGKTISTDSYTFTALKVEHTNGYTITEVSNAVEGEEPTIITVYQYKNWKKNGRPDVPSLLKLMGDVQRSLSTSNTGSLMVMCDDGMSRTGVFITVMSEIDRVKVEGEMDIFQTIKAARTARPYMVSTVVDYEVCHEIIHNYLESFDTYANFK